METREYIDEWTKEKAVTNWSSDCTTRCNQMLLSIKTEFMAKCQAKLGVNERTIDAETLVRDAFKKAHNIEFSARVFDNTLPERVAASEAKRAERVAQKAAVKQFATVTASELAIINAWKSGHDNGSSDQKIHDDLAKTGVSKELLTKFFPNIAKK